MNVTKVCIFFAFDFHNVRNILFFLPTLNHLHLDVHVHVALTIASHQCRAFSPPSFNVTNTMTSLSSDEVAAAGCGGDVIEFTARPGQQINVTLVDLTHSDGDVTARRSACVNFFELHDTDDAQRLQVCATPQRHRHVMTSLGHNIKIKFQIQDAARQKFLLQLKGLMHECSVCYYFF